MDPRTLLPQFDLLLERYRKLKEAAQEIDLSDIPEEEVSAFIASATALIERVTGTTSTYSKEATRRESYDSLRLPRIAGTLQGLKTDVENGYLQSVAELVHANLFADYLEMATHLLESNYKDAAAVIAGSTLEAHLRQIALKLGIPLDVPGPKGASHKKAEILNADLTKAGAYSLLEQKNITAWLDLRNKAAHGRYSEYTKDNVDLLLAGIRLFISQFPA